MSQNLEYLIEIAREYRQKHGFSAEEQRQQVRSFAYGNLRLENEQVTKSDIDQAMESLQDKQPGKRIKPINGTIKLVNLDEG